MLPLYAPSLWAWKESIKVNFIWFPSRKAQLERTKKGEIENFYMIYHKKYTHTHTHTYIYIYNKNYFENYILSNSSAIFGS